MSFLASQPRKPSSSPADPSSARHPCLQNDPLLLARLRAVCIAGSTHSSHTGQCSDLLLTHSNTSSPSSAAHLTHAPTRPPLTQHSPIPVFHTQSIRPPPFKRRLPNRTHRDQRRAGHHRVQKVPTGRAPMASARHDTSRTGGARDRAASCRVPPVPEKRCAGFGADGSAPPARDSAGSKSAKRV